MSNSSYIKLTDKSKQQSITLEEVKNLLLYYASMLNNTGKQLNWNYSNAAFPYEIHTKEYNHEQYLSLQGTDPQYYHALYIGLSQDNEHYTIQVTLPPNATFGDKSKANEFMKFLGKKLKGELHLFNDRIIHYTKMKI